MKKSNYLPYNFYRDFFKFAQLQPREVGGKLLIKGWCHDSDQHSVWFNIDDCTVECGVCGKMALRDYIDKVYPAFTYKDVFAYADVSDEDEKYLQELYYSYWQVQHGQIDQLIEEYYFSGYEVTEKTKEEMISGVEFLKGLCEEQILLANLNREIKDDGNYFFRGLPLVLKQGSKQQIVNEECAWQTDEVETRLINKYFWCWNGGEYERNDFFKAAFENHDKYKKRVTADAQTMENLLRLSGTQRQKLLYDVLASYYPLVEVSQNDADDLLDFCKSQKNQTANDTGMKLNWENGLAKLVTFGLGVSMTGAASMTWCYEIEELPTKRRFTGRVITWESWGLRIKAKIEEVIHDGLEFDDAWNKVRPLVYCQNRLRLTLNEADRMRLQGYINSYLKNGYAEWPETLRGEIGDNYEFVVDFRENFEIRDKVGFNAEGRAAFNRQRGCDQVMERFEAAFPNVKCGQIITTKELKAAGYTDKKAITRLVKHEILENFAYGKYRVLWVE